ncbi:multiprotein-bridging factor 1 family protein [Psychroflexus sp. ALD_RP9]|uniref:helix-turn-helix domain-containing protein n=1 Tax=Psychroflexus sp. ALD_RP9 TaxID=2777186 RepID=UPI001A9009AD|nr:helix-turn-helix transcriptional regulator [Psychroflexus sp. ALD_RP9]QSS97811.1 helix-turn-helix transcriptional regulator [Psychroflexus sp. ALD_RP9]
MSIENIKNRLKTNSIQDKSWIESAKNREKNEAWLDISFAIAVKIMSQVKANKIADKFPKTQKELASAMECSPQYINKLLKGTENLQLETITKLEAILNISLIKVPNFETSFKLDTQTTKTMVKSTTDVYQESNTLSYESLISSIFESDEHDNHLKPVA